MDLNWSKSILYGSLLVLGFTSQLAGQARLRLDNTTLGPISVAQGQNGPNQIINAVNAGNGSLNLTATTATSWLTATVGQTQSCGTLGAGCNPITIGLKTASLAKGTYTGTVTITDPAAIDSPQVVTVTVAIGGGVPDSLTIYLPNNGTPVKQNFSAASALKTSINAPSQVNVSIGATSGGSFATVYTYTLTAKAVTGTADGSYTGSVAVSGSTVSAENKTVPITFNVTSKPVASLGSINGFRIATGAAKQTQYITVANLNSGTINVAAPTVTAANGGTWLTAAVVSGVYVGVTADPTGLQPGTYTGTVTVNSDAANGAISVPVQLDVVAAGAPLIRVGGVLDNATFQAGTFAQGELPAVFGEQFTTGDPKQNTTTPWSTTLGGASVFINDQPVPLYYVSASQINFQVPYEAALGVGTLRVDRDGQRGNTVSINIAKSSPKLLVAVNQAGAVVSGPFNPSAVPVPASSFVTIYALGLGPTSPAVSTGAAAPSSPLSSVLGTNTMFFGAGGLFSMPASQTPQFIGLTPTFVGLYQINVQVPASAPKGTAIPVYLQGDIGTSNTLTFYIQ